MPRRVEGKAAIVVGGGQTPGQTVGNGRATAIVLGREGARVCVVDRELASAQETADLIKKEGGDAWAFAADVTREDDVNDALGVGHQEKRYVNVEVKYSGPDGVMVDVSETGWVGASGFRPN